MFPDFKESAIVENRAKTGQMLNFPGLCFPICRLMIRMSPFHHSDSKYPLLSK